MSTDDPGMGQAGVGQMGEDGFFVKCLHSGRGGPSSLAGRGAVGPATTRSTSPLPETREIWSTARATAANALLGKSACACV